MKVDQCQPHENSWTDCQSSQVVNWVKTKPELAGNQIPFGGTRFGFTTVGVYNTSIIETYTGPLSKILAVKVKFSDTFFRKRFSSIIGLYSDFMFETEKNPFST